MRTIINFSKISVILLTIFVTACKQGQNYKEEHRPQFHFSPPAKWMNDPNGLVFLDGEYHLFYQYYPDSTVWGPMHWGHAVSKDLVHWEHLPIALYPDSLGYIFSGSAVIDWNNTSGLQEGENPVMVAIFTHHTEIKDSLGTHQVQRQSIAYSNDKGRTFKKYKGNPVLTDSTEKDFRDPKVFWSEDFKKWVMIVAAGQKIKFYGSENLLNWQYLSSFGETDGAHGGVWECPDLFPMKKDTLEKWVLIVNINPGGPNGGSGTQYFIGSFDGKSFLNENPSDSILWLDYGPDNYAGVTWSDIPKSDGRRIFIGWMSNWDYAQTVPTTTWRNAMTLPRTLELKNTSSGIRLNSEPVNELQQLRNAKQNIVSLAGTEISISGLNEIFIDFDLTESKAENFGLIFTNKKNEELVVGFDKLSNRIFIDRTKSGKTDFSDKFAKKHFAPRIVNNSILKLHLFLDVASVEIFADDGLTCMTEIFFPNRVFDTVKLYQNKGMVKYSNFEIYDLNSIW